MRARTAAALFLALAIVHTWPLARAPWRLSLNHNADAQLNEWIVSWVAHTLPADPTHLFDGNIFAPDAHTLVYSDPLILPGLAGAPIRWLGGSPVLTFNILLIVGLALTALSAWFVAYRWTGSATAALVAGTAAAFNVHLLTRLPHLQAAHAWGLPLAWYFADALAGRASLKTTAALAAVLAATAATSLYWFVFAATAVAIVGVCSLDLRAIIRIAGAGALGLVFASPVLWPYATFAAAGATRPLELVAQFVATPAGYLVSTSHLYSRLTSMFWTNDVNVFFPGLVVTGLALLGLAHAEPLDTGPQRRRLTIVAIAVVGVVLSFGPSTPIYRVLYAWVAPLRGIRAAARFGYLLLLAVAFAAAGGAAWIERRWPSRRRSVVAAVLLTLVTIEVWQSPVRTVPFDGVPRIYTLLADVPGPVRLVEVPYYLPDTVFENGEYVLNSTAHWRPLLNGYSGVTPDSYRERAEKMWLFPAEFAMQTIHAAGVTHVMVHLERFGADARDIERALQGRSDFRLIATDRAGHRLYEVSGR